MTTVLEREETRHEAEAIERAAIEALHAAADEELRERLRLALVPVGDGIASVAGALPASAITINRVIGLGLTRPVRPEDVETAVAIYRDAGAARFFLNVHPDARGAALEAACRAAGLAPAQGWQKFERGREERIPEVDPAIELRPVGLDEADAFGRIVADAFDLGDVAAPWIARIHRVPGWRPYLAFVDGAPAGAGALFVRDRVAWTDFGATAPAFRQRGVQRSLLAHRVRVALEAGCERIHSCTGEAVPGDPQHSFANIVRCGFRPTYVRENRAPPKP